MLCSAEAREKREASAPGLGVGVAQDCVVRIPVQWPTRSPVLKANGEEGLYKWEGSIILRFSGRGRIEVGRRAGKEGREADHRWGSPLQMELPHEDLVS